MSFMVSSNKSSLSSIIHIFSSVKIKLYISPTVLASARLQCGPGAGAAAGDHGAEFEFLSFDPVLPISLITDSDPARIKVWERVEQGGRKVFTCLTP